MELSFPDIDADECTIGSHDCDMSANCTNTEGSFTCQCITGYYGDGYNCTSEFLSQIHVHLCQLKCSV